MLEQDYKILLKVKIGERHIGYSVPISQIKYVETADKKSTFYTENTNYTITESLTFLTKILKNKGFLRISKKLLLNTFYITGGNLKTDKIYMSDKTFDVPRDMAKKIREILGTDLIYKLPQILNNSKEYFGTNNSETTHNNNSKTQKRSELRKILHLLINETSQTNIKLKAKFGNVLNTVFLTEVFKITENANSTTIHIKNERPIQSETKLIDYRENLKDFGFVQIDEETIINAKYILSIEFSKKYWIITLSNGKNMTIRRDFIPNKQWFFEKIQ